MESAQGAPKRPRVKSRNNSGRPQKPAPKQQPSSSSRQPPPLPRQLAVLRCCFYELLVARQPIEIAERASGARIPMTLEGVRPRVEARLRAAGLAGEGAEQGVQLSHYAQLAAILPPSLLQMRWTTCTAATEPAGAEAGGPAKPVLDLVIPTGTGRRGQTAAARLKAAEKALQALGKAARKAAKDAARAVRGSNKRPKKQPADGVQEALLLDAALQQVMPKPAPIPSAPPSAMQQPSGRRPTDPATSAGGTTRRERELAPMGVDGGGGGRRRLLSPSEVAALLPSAAPRPPQPPSSSEDAPPPPPPPPPPRGAALLRFLQAQPWYSAQLVASVLRPARPARYGALRGGDAESLPPPLWCAFQPPAPPPPPHGARLRRQVRAPDASSQLVKLTVSAARTLWQGGAAGARHHEAVPPPEHQYPDRNSELTETTYDFEIGSA
jgi:hypothetical protein